MLHDVEFFQSRLAKIDGFGDTAEYLKGIIKSKEVKSAPPATKAGSGSGDQREDGSDSGSADGEGELSKPESK